MPDHSVLELLSDGIPRTALYRKPTFPSAAPPDAVIWLHGGGELAEDFLHKIRPRPHVVDVAPQGLVTRGEPGWVNPWEGEDDRPRDAPDSLIDVRFIGILEDHVRKNFPTVARVWLCGFSAGGAVVWSSWALRPTIANTFAGLGIVGKKLHHQRLNGWDWGAAVKRPIPFVMVNGTRDDPDRDVVEPREKYSWDESYAEARKVNGNTMNADAASSQSTCGDYTVRLKVASGGDAPSARYIIDGLGHTWMHNDGCHTDDFIIERFTAYGLGNR